MYSYPHMNLNNLLSELSFPIHQRNFTRCEDLVMFWTQQPTFWKNTFQSAKLELEMEKRKEGNVQFHAI